MTTSQSIIFFLVALFCSYQGLSQKRYFLDSFLSKSWSTSEGFSDLQEISPNVSGKLSDFAIDPIGGHIYYAEVKDAFGDGTPRIFRTALDGSGFQTIVPEADAGLPQQLALDLTHQMLYWTAGTYPNVSIRRADLGGANPSVVVDLTNSNALKGLLLDPANNKMYWTVEYSTDISYANLDGASTGIFSGANSSDEYCFDLALHPVEGKLYWVTEGSFGESSKLYKSNLDGSSKVAIADLGFSKPLGLEVDTANNKVYWSLWLEETIYRSDLDGSNQEEYFRAEDYISPENVGDISEIAFDYAETSGTGDLSENGHRPGFGMFPNPVGGTNSIVIEFLPGALVGANAIMVQIIDLRGKVMAIQSFVPSPAIAVTHHLSQGYYQVLVRTDKGVSLGANSLIVD